MFESKPFISYMKLCTFIKIFCFPQSSKFIYKKYLKFIIKMYSTILNIASANAIAVYFLAFQKNYSLLQKVALHFKNINELEMKLSDYDNDKKNNNILLLCFQFQFHLRIFF